MKQYLKVIRKHFQSDYTASFLLNHTDFADFSDETVNLVPYDFDRSPITFQVTVFGDSLLEPQEEIVISLDQSINLSIPAPFRATKTASPANSMVSPPDNEQIIIHYPSAKIIIREGD